MKGNLTLVKYQEGDALKFKHKEIFSGDPTLIERIEKLSKEKTNLCYTMYDKSGPIAILGCSFIFPCVCDLWSILSDRIKIYPKEFCKLIREFLAKGEKLHGIYRYQMVTRAQNPELVKWAQFLGMKCEGLMHKFGPDKSDFLLFARVS